MIRKIEGLDNMQNLEDLDLSSNRISKLENLERLTSLQKLNLSYNLIFLNGPSPGLSGLTLPPLISSQLLATVLVITPFVLNDGMFFLVCVLEAFLNILTISKTFSKHLQNLFENH